MVERNNEGEVARAIHCRFFDWNDSEFIKLQTIKNSRRSNIFVEQHYGPDTTYRRNLAKAERKKLKDENAIFSGHVKYPAKLFVKYAATDRNYSLHSDFSDHDVPLPTRWTLCVDFSSRDFSFFILILLWNEL